VDVRLLGSGGWIPTETRETCCLYARKGNEVLLVDAGTGVRRLLLDPSLLDGVERLTVLLTHFHLDHVVGLPWLADASVERREVWAPGLMTMGREASDVLRPLLEPPLYPSPVTDSFARIDDLPDLRFELGPFALELRVQERHVSPTLGVKIDQWLAYCTDTADDPATASFASEARVLYHEAWYAEEATDDRGHTASGEAARIASAAGVERLVLIHVNPLHDDEAELLRFARLHFAATEVGRDGVSLSMAAGG
jgi:ribonuclease BN (tRNA processing enzyme)